MENNIIKRRKQQENKWNKNSMQGKQQLKAN